MNESIRYQLPPYCHNLVEMQLIRLPMTPRFSVSSKDGSNIEGCSASSSEDDCNIVFTWVWTWYHMDVSVGELSNP